MTVVLDEVRAVLVDPATSLTQLLKALPAAEAAAARTVRVGVSAAVTVDLLGVHLRRHGAVAGIRVDVVPGNLDDPVGDMARFRAAGVEHVVLLPFFDQLVPAMEAQVGALPAATLDALETGLRDRYRLAMQEARSFATVTLGTLHRLGRSTESGGRDAVAAVLDRLDDALREEAAAHPHVTVLDTSDVVTAVGRGAAFDLRFYFRARAPWTGAFLGELARRVVVSTRGFGQVFRKVLVLDCDGTLWGGVLGEDTVDGIALGPHDHPGNVFWRVQHELAALRRRGVLLCLCTKNEVADVEDALAHHPHAVLRRADFAAVRIDWADKPDNLRALADELGLGLDSMVFLDDSAFECEAVRAQLPEVTTVQVPAVLSRYPEVVAGIAELFVGGTADGADKTDQYRQRARAAELQRESVDHETYLASLQLQVRVGRDLPADVARIAELSQKTNQFTLTGRRYGAADVEDLIGSPDHVVYGVEVHDVFGSAGLTGAAVLSVRGEVAEVDSFFLSCRVLGRGVEDALWPAVLADLTARGVLEVRATHVPGARNQQVADFYDRLGLTPEGDPAGGARRYRGTPADLPTAPPSWIELTSRG